MLNRLRVDLGNSRDKAEALASDPNVPPVKLQSGKLALYEEFRDAVASAIAKSHEQSTLPERAEF